MFAIGTPVIIIRIWVHCYRMLYISRVKLIYKLTLFGLIFNPTRSSEYVTNWTLIHIFRNKQMDRIFAISDDN